MAGTESHGEQPRLQVIRPDLEQSLELENQDAHEDETAGLYDSDEDDMSEDFETTSEDMSTVIRDPSQSLVDSSFYPSLPLDHTRREIRLIRVLPGVLDQPIQCILCIVSLNEYPTYEALSYTWGSASRGRMVKVNREYINVTDNLVDALMSLRQTHQPRTLWIDALCIDQSNVAERNEQVAMMDQIYRSATRVLVWLGGASVPEAVPKSPFLTEVMSTIDDSRLWKLEDHKLRSLLAAICWAKPHWWERMWIVQEYILASSEPVAYFGRHSVPWTELSNMLATVRKIDLSAHPAVADFSDSLSDLTNIKQSFRAGVLSLEELILRTARKTATDRRDRLYSLKNLLCAPAAAGICIDYSQETWEVFARTTYHAIVNARDLTILHLVKPDPMGLRRSGSGDVPSWAVDFAPNLSWSTGPWKRDLFDGVRSFRWSNSKITWMHGIYQPAHLQSQISRDARRLTCKGFFVDNVRAAFNDERYSFVDNGGVAHAHFLTQLSFAQTSGFRRSQNVNALEGIDIARKIGGLVFSSLAYSQDANKASLHAINCMKNAFGCNFNKTFNPRKHDDEVLKGTTKFSQALEQFYHHAAITVKHAREHARERALDELWDESASFIDESKRYGVFKGVHIVLDRVEAILTKHRSMTASMMIQMRDHERRGQYIQHLEQFWRLCTNAAKPSMRRRPPAGHDSTRMARTISLSLDVLREDPSHGTLGKTEEKFAEAVKSWSYYDSCNNGKTMVYLTEAGFAGLGLGEMECGDVVAIIGHGPSPVILRPADGGFTFRGFTYIPFAEYLADAEFEPREFVLL